MRPRAARARLFLQKMVCKTAELADRVLLCVSYAGVVEEYALREGQVSIHVSVAQDVPKIRYLVPLLVTDGSDKSDIEVSEGNVTVLYRGATYTVSFDAAYRVKSDDTLRAIRNGLYKVLVLETDGSEIEVELMLGSVSA